MNIFTNNPIFPASPFLTSNWPTLFLLFKSQASTLYLFSSKTLKNRNIFEIVLNDKGATRQIVPLLLGTVDAFSVVQLPFLFSASLRYNHLNVFITTSSEIALHTSILYCSDFSLQIAELFYFFFPFFFINLVVNFGGTKVARQFII